MSPTRQFSVAVTTIYAFSMAKKVFIQLRGVPNPKVLRADKVVQGGAFLDVKDGEQVVGSFKGEDVQGWWIEEK